MISSTYGFVKLVFAYPFLKSKEIHLSVALFFRAKSKKSLAFVPSSLKRGDKRLWWKDYGLLLIRMF